MILSIIFIAIAAMFNAVMDTLTNHFDTSVFKKLNLKWWNPNYSWEYVKPFLGWVRLDAWHLAKFGMLFSGFAPVGILFGLKYWLLSLLLWGIIFELIIKLLKKTS